MTGASLRPDYPSTATGSGEAIRAHASASGAIEGAFAALALRFPDVPHTSVPIGASGDGHARAAAKPQGPAAEMAVCRLRRRATG